MNTTEEKATEVNEFLLAKQVENIRTNAMQQSARPYKRVLLIWIPFVFSVCITFLAIKLPGGAQSSLTPYICFLPMAFFLSAQSVFTETSALDRRIQALEEALKEKEKKA